jgi:restriction system protein
MLPGREARKACKCVSHRTLDWARTVMGVDSAILLLLSNNNPPPQVIRESGLLLQAIVVPEGGTSEGTLIQAVAPVWYEIIRRIQEDPDFAFQLDPRKWEELIAGAYKRKGFDEVILTPRSGDFGRDVIAVKRGWYSVRFIDQVKRYNKDHFVTLEEVDAMLGVLNREKNTTKGIVTTTSDFAPRIDQAPGIKDLIPHRLELVNGTKLFGQLAELAKADGLGATA